jgi:hypothetical protein
MCYWCVSQIPNGAMVVMCRIRKEVSEKLNY